MLTQVEKELNAAYSARETAIKIARGIIPLCAQSIRDIQKDKYSSAEKNLVKIQAKIRQCEKTLVRYPELKMSVLSAPYQEYAELSIFLSLLKRKKLPKLDVPAKFYLLGLGDAIGELKRVGMGMLASHKIKEAEKLRASLEDLYYEFSKNTYPNSMVPGLKQKQDAMRRVLNDFESAIQSHKLTRP